MQIDVDFEVYKALTAMRQSENHGYNDVLRELLNLSPKIVHHLQAQGAATGVPSGSGPSLNVNPIPGLHSRGLFLPEGTELRATYKGAQYFGQVRDGVIFSQGGKMFTSPSSAASSITKTTVNGWRFWEAKRPNDLSWHRLDQLP
jgi:hypothetical protein